MGRSSKITRSRSGPIARGRQSQPRIASMCPVPPTEARRCPGAGSRRPQCQSRASSAASILPVQSTAPVSATIANRQAPPSVFLDVNLTQRDDGGVDAFYSANYGLLVRSLTVVAGSSAVAEDAVQEAFVRLLPRWRRVSRYDQPQAWVRRVALNLILSDRRRRARMNEESSLDDQAGRAQVSSDEESSADLARAIQSLPPELRALIVLTYFFDLDVKAVASELSLAEGTVKSRLHRARKQLAEYLGSEWQYA